MFEILIIFATLVFLYAFSDDIIQRLAQKKLKRRLKKHMKQKQKEKGSDVNGFNV